MEGLADEGSATGFLVHDFAAEHFHEHTPTHERLGDRIVFRHCGHVEVTVLIEHALQPRVLLLRELG
eukprot:7688814-Pyramimonas_sp.AAC.1